MLRRLPDAPHDLRAFPYGPFHRLESPTQTPETARVQAISGQIWGQAPRGSAWPQVQAYRGVLPADARGIEFWTDVPPDPNGHPWEARWSRRGRPTPEDITEHGEFVRIRCVVVKDSQS